MGLINFIGDSALLVAALVIGYGTHKWAVRKFPNPPSLVSSTPDD